MKDPATRILLSVQIPEIFRHEFIEVNEDFTRTYECKIMVEFSNIDFTRVVIGKAVKIINIKNDELGQIALNWLKSENENMTYLGYLIKEYIINKENEGVEGSYSLNIKTEI